MKNSALFDSTKNSIFPSANEISDILNYGRRYPSGDNSQCFTLLQILDNEFEIHYHPNKGKHYLNSNYIPTLLSLGFLIESVSIGASQKSCKIIFKTDCDFKSDGPKWAKFTIVKDESTTKDFLADYIDKRHTNRGLYNSKVTEIEKLVLNSSLKASFNNCLVSCKISSIDKHIIKYFQKCEEAFWSRKNIISDLGQWIFLNIFKNPSTGFYWKTLGVSYFEIMGLKLFSKFSFISQKLSPILTLVNKMKFKKQLKNSAGIIYFTVPKGTNIDFVETGRTIFRGWLQLTALEYEVQPLSLGSLLPYYLTASNNSIDIDTAWANQVKLEYQSLKTKLQIDSSREILWTFRFGRKLETEEDITFSNREESLYLIKKPHNI